MFDILGYKDLLEHNKLDDIVDIYYNCIKNREMPVFAFGNLRTSDLNPSVQAERLMFSDTFILYNRFYDDEKPVEKLQRTFAYLIYCVYLLRFSFDSGIPLRGALSFGEYYIDKEDSCFLGSPILEAYNESNRQNWCGAVVCNSALNVIKEILKNDDVSNYIRNKHQFCRNENCDKLCDKDIEELIIEYEIPYKDYCSKNCYNSKGIALRWDDFVCKDLIGFALDSINIDTMGGCIRSLQEICRVVRIAFGDHNKNIAESDVKKKIEETSQFFDYINCNYSSKFEIEKSNRSFRLTKIM